MDLPAQQQSIYSSAEVEASTSHNNNRLPIHSLSPIRSLGDQYEIRRNAESSQSQKSNLRVIT